MQSKNSAQQSFRAGEIQAQNSDAALLAAQDSMSAAQGSFRRGEINAQNMLDPAEIQAQFRQTERDYRSANDTGANSMSYRTEDKGLYGSALRAASGNQQQALAILGSWSEQGVYKLDRNGSPIVQDGQSLPWVDTGAMSADALAGAAVRGGSVLGVNSQTMAANARPVASDPMWSFRDASMAQRKLDDAQALAVYEARLDGGPVMKAWDGNVGMSPQQKFEQNLATAYYAPVVAAGVGLAAYAGGSAFLAGQLAKVPATELGYSQLATGMGISGGVSALIYAGLNGGDSTPAGISIAFTGGAIGGGLVKPSMNFGAQLANTAIPLTWSNAMTQATGMAYGFGAAGWVNKAGLTVTGQSWWTQPVYPMPENSIKKP